ncbi:MAG TPA: UDP-N-acetylmuramoyl-L-alanyl-D-glutamate--2,6-diaminopimelate ligase [Tepidisphaeraceae bacterium]|jgi:UDP-N-acetylmuramoyl-L-alanyl-D-glutamate--2,6-diaminopimelate ligase|nr:UDP-N-acetylmuramoyl-L-alanyl-D-glutamate--2,6-diaminopimelate ligase [Tepidisphaeraceae bacterium]
MLLHDLIRQFDPRVPLAGIPDVEISGISEDSRRVTAGSLFVARTGTQADGTKFLDDARNRGAAAAIVQTQSDASALPQIVTADTGAAASIFANLFRGNPGATVKPLAVTGTNGKTTTAYIVRHLLTNANIRCGMIGTVEIDDGKNRRESEMTTPAACDVADLLANMRDNGCRACVMETSSHALHQGRVAGVSFVGAAFTNLTGDHLDYHLTEENYAAAKASLFASLDPLATAAINIDDRWSGRMIENCAARIIRFGMAKGADYRASDVKISASGTHFILDTPDGCAEVSMQLIGRHNIENALAAAAIVGESFGLSVHQIAAGLRDAQGAPGRLQAVRAGQRFAVLVDYAHTDDALQNVLSALRPLTRGKLRVLFGCGGDRDRTKRPRMAKIAEKLADFIYVTSDNPRTEDPRSIIAEIAAGFSSESASRVAFELDRRAAIDRILNDARADDVVLLAGKGHENYQIIGTEKRHFDDVEEARRFLTSGRVARGDQVRRE